MCDQEKAPLEIPSGAFLFFRFILATYFCH